MDLTMDPNSEINWVHWEGNKVIINKYILFEKESVEKQMMSWQKIIQGSKLNQLLLLMARLSMLTC